MNVGGLAHTCPCRHRLAHMDKWELSHVATIFEHSFVYPCKFATSRGYECQRCSSSMLMLSWIFTGGQMGAVHMAMAF